MNVDEQLIAQVEAVSRGVAPPKSDDELAHDLEGIARSAGIQLRPARRVTERGSFEAFHAEVVKQVRRELRAEREALLNEANERKWEAERAERRAEKARKAAEQLKKDAEADRQFARKAQEAADATLAEAKQVTGEAADVVERRQQVAEWAKALEAEKARLDEWKRAVKELTHRLREESDRIEGPLRRGAGPRGGVAQAVRAALAGPVRAAAPGVDPRDQGRRVMEVGETIEGFQVYGAPGDRTAVAVAERPAPPAGAEYVTHAELEAVAARLSVRMDSILSRLDRIIPPQRVTTTLYRCR